MSRVAREVPASRLVEGVRDPTGLVDVECPKCGETTTVRRVMRRGPVRWIVRCEHARRFVAAGYGYPEAVLFAWREPGAWELELVP